jgi:hypothetical protein
MFRLALILISAGMFAVVSSAVADKKDKPDDDGFVSIFDGKTLKGWHVSAKTGHSKTSGNKSAANGLSRTTPCSAPGHQRQRRYPDHRQGLWRL